MLSVFTWHLKRNVVKINSANWSLQLPKEAVLTKEIC